VRLQLSVGAALLVACGGASQRHDLASVDMRTAIYQDTNDTTVGTGTVAARGHPTDETTISGRYLLDVTTTASVDVVSAATHRWDEPRHEIMGGGAWSNGETGLNGAYVYSTENDWSSHTGTIGGTQDWGEHDYQLQWSASYVWNDVWRRNDQNFRRQQQSATGTLALVVTPSPTDLVSIGYFFSWVGGYQESPYRYARFEGPIVSGPPYYTAAEEVPDDRFRHALTLRWNHLLQDGLALRSHARAYLDDWGIGSLTIGSEIRGRVDDTDLGFMLRAYGQLGASFWHDVYPVAQRYMSSDRELSPFVDLFGGPFLAYRARQESSSELRFELRLTGFLFHFFEFARLTERYGVVAEVACGGTF
jgi:hypothetical protein